MQQYKSSKNEEIDRRLAKHLEKQRGEIPFEIEANKSGRITTKFVREYAVPPFIVLTPLVNDDVEFEVIVNLTGRTKTEFTINIQNTGTIAAKGIVMWLAE